MNDTMPIFLAETKVAIAAHGYYHTRIGPGSRPNLMSDQWKSREGKNPV